MGESMIMHEPRRDVVLYLQNLALAKERSSIEQTTYVIILILFLAPPKD